MDFKPKHTHKILVVFNNNIYIYIYFFINKTHIILSKNNNNMIIYNNFFINIFYNN